MKRKIKFINFVKRNIGTAVLCIFNKLKHEKSKITARLVYAKIKNAAFSVKNEVLEMIERVQEKMGRLALPIVSAKYFAKIPNRDKVQDIENAKNFLERNSITTFAQLEKYKTDKGKEFDSREQIFIPKRHRLEQLKELAKAYADYEP